ncbi:MAG: hypothetical protein NVSMB2_01840 [Chloroflexota bacterium]
MRISIVTPTLNAERYIDDCLQSIWSQAGCDLEHIVVDGGSSDGTETHVRLTRSHWRSRPGLGQSAAINAGFQESTGDVIAWLNADDLYRPGALNLIAENFDLDESIDAIIGDCDMIDSDGRVLQILRPGQYDPRRLLSAGNYVPQPAVFVRRTVIECVGGLDESLEYGMDYDLWLRLRACRVVYLPRVLAAFRWHASSKTANNLDGNWRELLIIVRRYGGGWTVPLLRRYLRARLTAASQRLPITRRA